MKFRDVTKSAENKWITLFKIELKQKSTKFQKGQIEKWEKVINKSFSPVNIKYASVAVGQKAEESKS